LQNTTTDISVKQLGHLKKCIWCNKTSSQVSFDKKAHVVPQSLGGQEICDNVCDDCNKYFGNKNSQGPSIEEAIKETFHISRLRFLYATGDIGKNKALTKPNSLFFNVDLSKPKVSLKTTYKLKPLFEERFCRSIKRGLFKMFLEETERLFKTGHDDKYDFIREFARYDLGDYPVLYFNRRHGIILQENDYPKSPKLYLDPDARQKFLMSDYGFYEFEFMAHVFAIPTTKAWNLSFDIYKRETEKLKKDLFTGFKIIERLHDIDITLRILN
jgi:hypothetical protein